MLCQEASLRTTISLEKNGLLCCLRMSRNDDVVMYPVERMGCPQEGGQVPWCCTRYGLQNAQYDWQ